MALVESPDFKHIFADTSEMQVFEALLGELPTPPLSPDHAEAGDRSQLTDTTQEELDVGESILQQMMESSEEMPFDSQGSYGSDSSADDVLDIDPNILIASNHALLQDCMWNCDAYEPRHSIGIYTPAPSPPPKCKEAAIEEEEEEQVFEGSKCKKQEGGEQLEEDDECISPNEVLVLLTAEAESAKEDDEQTGVCEEEMAIDREMRKPVLGYRRSMSSSNARLHPQATTSSESEEEIDVVTISDRPEKLVTRINIRKRTTSLSTPCSRLPSPSHMLPTKKRRCHSKRTHRLSSAGSNYGDGMESDDEQRRASHNVLERKRRDDLKYSFQVLRGQIPELKDNQRAPKVTILRKAAEYIKQIREEDEDMQTRMDKEKRRESKLLQRLAYLKSLA